MLKSSVSQMAYLVFPENGRTRLIWKDELNQLILNWTGSMLQMEYLNCYVSQPAPIYSHCICFGLSYALSDADVNEKNQKKLLLSYHFLSSLFSYIFSQFQDFFLTSKIFFSSFCFYTRKTVSCSLHVSMSRTWITFVDKAASLFTFSLPLSVLNRNHEAIKWIVVLRTS